MKNVIRKRNRIIPLQLKKIQILLHLFIAYPPGEDIDVWVECCDKKYVFFQLLSILWHKYDKKCLAILDSNRWGAKVICISLVHLNTKL